eukprot:GILI01006413.1.p1 GENE.GILI01006413.1~~GILI01006413.1.p1  ORF type:complete len:687 (+),score=216.12 GILI01006413.1:187-2247(+)
MKSMGIVALCALICLFVSPLVSADEDMCTTIIVGSKASADGSVMATHTADCRECDSRFFRVPAKDFPEGAMRPVYLGAEGFTAEYPRYIGFARAAGYHPLPGQKETEPLGYIPQVRHTYAYFDTVYGVMNEKQVGIGESTCAAKITAKPKGHGGEALLDMGELTRLAMERAATAREAIQVIGSLAETHGFYGGWASENNVGTAGEALTIIDPKEAWIMHIMASPDGKGAVWAAQRIPDEHVAVVSNQFMIQTLDLSKPDFFLASANVVSVAEQMGYWNSSMGPFDFTLAYSTQFKKMDYVPFYSSLRTWRVLSLAAPSLSLTPWVKDNHDLPFSVKPDRALTLNDVFRMKRDYYEGTEFDLSKGLAAGPYGTPTRVEGGYSADVKGQWGRAVSIVRTSYATVLQARSWLPDALGGLVWLAMDAPHTSVFVPFLAGAEDTAPSFQRGFLKKFSRESAWWAFDFVSNWADLKYSYMIQDIRPEQSRLETRSLEMLKSVEASAQPLIEAGKTQDALALITKACSDNAEQIVADWWNLADYLIAKYNDGFVNLPTIRSVGYPEWWAQLVGFDINPQFKTPELLNYTLTQGAHPVVPVSINGPVAVPAANPVPTQPATPQTPSLTQAMRVSAPASSAHASHATSRLPISPAAVAGIISLIAVVAGALGYMVGRSPPRKLQPLSPNTVYQRT